MTTSGDVRTCAWCSRSLLGKRTDARTCSQTCRTWMHRARTGAAEPPSWFWSSPGVRLGGTGRESRSDIAEKRLLRATATRTGRARQFVAEWVLPSPGHHVTARNVFRAYLTWTRDHEPDEPLSYGAFLTVLQDQAPIEERRTVPRPRGRPALAFAGITVIGNPASAAA